MLQSAHLMPIPQTREEREATVSVNDSTVRALQSMSQTRGNDALATSARQAGVGSAQGGNSGDVETEPPKELTMEEILSKVILHANKPIENLPSIVPPELKIIGRCVSFKGDTKDGDAVTSMRYEGLVGTINKDTVMLIHVHRYTEEDYQIHKLEVVEHKEKDSRDGKDAGEVQKQAAPVPGEHANEQGTPSSTQAHPPTYSPQSEAANSPANSNLDGLDIGPGDSTAPPPAPLHTVTGDDHGDTTRRVRNRMRDHTGSMGPIPFMTFSRSKIHEVEFAQDPRSSFYSLFRDPSKQFFDMQCLRMFCRRYIVHTAQGNNPRQIPLRAFVTCRCNCPDLDNELLVQITREEIGHLVKVDRDCARAKKRKESNRRNVLRMYRAPPGPFMHTGVLYLTHIPKQTYVLGLLEFVLSLVIAVYSMVSFVSVDEYVVLQYSMRYLAYVIPCIMFGLLSSLFTVTHSVRMSLPLRRHVVLSVARFTAVMGGIGTCLMAMIILSRSFKVENVRKYMQSANFQDVCAYYFINDCFGFDAVTCASDAWAANYSTLSRDCRCGVVLNVTNMDMQPPCKNLIMGDVERGMIPLVCFSLVLFILLWFDHFLHYKLYYVSRLLQQRM